MAGFHFTLWLPISHKLTLATVLNAFIVRMGFHLAVLKAFFLVQQLLTGRRQNLLECRWRTAL